MKKYLFILLFTPAFANAQDHTKMYITPVGDTVRPEMRIRFASDKVLQHIYPGGITDAARLNAARRYQGTTMPGQMYEITRLTRFPAERHKYKAIAVIKVHTPEINRWNDVEYFIEIDKALAAGEITIVKP